MDKKPGMIHDKKSLGWTVFWLAVCTAFWLLGVWLIWPSPSHAFFLDDWDTGDRLLLAGYSTAWFLDWGQTREIAENQDFYEKNTWLGRHPDQETANVYFIGMYALNLFVADTLEGWWRKVYLAGFALMHYQCVRGNSRLGIALNFRF